MRKLPVRPKKCAVQAGAVEIDSRHKPQTHPWDQYREERRLRREAASITGSGVADAALASASERESWTVNHLMSGVMEAESVLKPRWRRHCVGTRTVFFHWIFKPASEMHVLGAVVWRGDAVLPGPKKISGQYI
jgi:hypothetical protein